ncbi:MAG TPA: hypothetical protein VFZ14_03410 [Burkholderiales bacterium]|jgi:hypothetical protein|nr:hypothetical protein [Burkholderiales bacterium]
MDENVRNGQVIAVALWIVAGILFAAGVSWWVSSGGARGGPNQPVPASDAAPALQSAPPPELQAYLREKQQRLESYGWIDRAAQRVHIPIERAMQLMQERQ